MEQDLVTLMCENEGAPIPRHRLAFKQAEYAGRFTLKEEYDRDSQRNVVMARLRSRGEDILPPLRDARTLQHERGIMIVTGLEVLSMLTRRRTAQTWYIKTAGYHGPGRDLDAMPTAD